MSVARARSGCAVVCIEGNVYVMGGRDGGSGSYFKLKSAEMYDAPARQWRAAVMSEVRRGLIGCAAVCMEGNVLSAAFM